ncbi:MAG: peptidoglycan DD-metalloendopeptidase family protein [Gammaproteobacteria bacterium]
MALNKRTPSSSVDESHSSLRLLPLQTLPPLLLLAFVIATAAMLTGCSGKAHAPVVSRSSGEQARPDVSSSGRVQQQSRSGYHRVKKGDTLYSIAWRYGLDYRRVAEWNGINKPYVIYPGQRLHLRADVKKRTQSARSPATDTGKTRQTQKPAASPSVSQSRSSSTTGDVKWRWPTAGQLVKLDTPIARKGISISGREGQSVAAAADGRVVYSGSGLLGYGKLIIIKHSDVYLSAYAHNDTIHVKEGDHVTVGQKIATMGLGNNGKPVLHFEIRKDGKPVSPLSYLPANRS